MRWPRFAVAVLIAALIQASWIDAIAVTRLNVAPDLLLIVMVFFAVRCNQMEAIISSFTVGLAASIITTGFPIGARIISFGLFGTGLSYMHRLITIRKMLHEAIAILVTGFCSGVLAYLLAIVAGRAPGQWSIGVVAGTSIYSAIVGPFLFLLLDWVMSIRNRRHGPGPPTR